MTKIFIPLFLLFTCNVYCFSQQSIEILGKKYTISTIGEMYVVSESVKNVTMTLRSEDVKRLRKCNDIFSTFNDAIYFLERCQKNKITPDDQSTCRAARRGIHNIIWSSPIESDKSNGIARWTIKKETVNNQNDNVLIESVASYFNINRSKIIIQNGNFDNVENTKWKYVQTKENRNFNLLKNFYAYADEYNQEVDYLSGGLRTYDNITRCSLLLHEAELSADVEYKIKIPGEIDATVQSKLEQLLPAFREIKIDSVENTVSKLIVVGAYIGHAFQELNFNSGSILKEVMAIFTSLFDKNFQLKHAVDYEAYRKSMNIENAEATIQVRLRASASE